MNKNKNKNNFIKWSSFNFPPISSDIPLAIHSIILCYFPLVSLYFPLAFLSIKKTWKRLFSWNVRGLSFPIFYGKLSHFFDGKSFHVRSVKTENLLKNVIRWIDRSALLTFYYQNNRFLSLNFYHKIEFAELMVKGIEKGEGHTKK